MNVPRMSAEDIFKSKITADEANKKIGVRRAGEKQEMGKDAFLKLLVTELKHQDPSQPMADREFIAQVTQFSTLEQMTNMNKEIASLLQSSRATEAFGLLGRKIEAFNQTTNLRTSGIVSSVQYKEGGHVLIVNGREVPMDDIHAVHDESTAGRQAALQQPVTATAPQRPAAPTVAPTVAPVPEATAR